MNVSVRTNSSDSRDRSLSVLNKIVCPPQENLSLQIPVSPVEGRSRSVSHDQSFSSLQIKRLYPITHINIQTILAGFPEIVAGFPAHLSAAQVSRVIKITQSFCDNSGMIGQTFSDFRRYLVDPNNSRKFNACLANIRDSVRI